MAERQEYHLYKDIQARTNGEIYIGVVGPVRTGKSTFIKRFMDLMVLPNITEAHKKNQTIDELPQSAQGKTIMTTEPKFVPKEAAEIQLGEGVQTKVRLIDCVGFMVEGATGHEEEGSERLVKTPWFDYEIPFIKAAEIGTQKVIRDHSTIGIVLTTDGSFTEIDRSAYEQAEEKAVMELQNIGKPFLILINSLRPRSMECMELAEQLQEKYQVTVLPINCDQMKKEDVDQILEHVLYEFPVIKIEFYVPKWVEMLEHTHRMKESVIAQAKQLIGDLSYVKDVMKGEFAPTEEYISEIKTQQVDLSNGIVRLRFEIPEQYYYQNMSELTGVEIAGEYQMISMLKELSASKKEYAKVLSAMESVRQKGYGVVVPDLSEVVLEAPVIIRHGNKYGVKIKANSPSVHLIKANIETEIAPIIGSEEQAQELVDYLSQSKDDDSGIWETNIFGKTVGELVEDGMRGKIAMMDDESQMKLQDTMQKVVNDSNGGMVCIII